MKIIKLLSICFLLILSACPILAQSIPEEAQKRLNHIIGKWELKTEYLGRNGEVRRTVTGTEEAKFIIEDKVVELTTTIPEQNQFSKAWQFYNTAEGKYYLTSVDAKGDHWVLSGGLDAYVITSLPKKQANGRELTIRFTHTNIQEDSFEAVMETSIDGGQSWWTRYRQYLTRL